MTVGKHAFSSSSTTEPDTSQSAVDVVDRGALTERWRAILVPGRIPKTGRNPAARPDAAALTQRLVANLTLKRLILLANVEHNKCRPSQLAGLSPYDRPRDPELAWKLLDHGMANLRMRENTAWMRTSMCFVPALMRGSQPREPCRSDR
jgi:hypothetical protein